MAFWKVSGFNQSPLELILDRDEFTLEDILDEDSDLVAECKSLNGRLVAFLKERSTVEQLVRYLVDPPLDADDPKRAYKYPFTACEVLCCEVEAVFNTLLEDAELMQLLFSLLGSPPPLSSKTAGYFGRVVGHLLLRKTNEMMQYLQEHSDILQQLVRHVDTTSIAEIIKRLVGADEQSSVLFLAQYAAWLAETPLVEQLLARLAEGGSPDAQANAADILCAIAHTQPSPLASKLTRQESISVLFTHALSPAQQVLVPALDVCIALIEPRRSIQAVEEVPAMQEAADKAKAEAVEAIVQYVPSLVQVLQSSNNGQQVIETPYGMLTPPLGRARLKAAELLAVLLRSGSPAAEEAIRQSEAVGLCLQLFGAHPFNNLLHHCVVAMLVAILTRASMAMLQHVFEECKLLEWLLGLPMEIRPTPLPGQEEAAATKPLLRAGYLGHVTQIASTLESFSNGHFQEVSSTTGHTPSVSAGGLGSLGEPEQQQQQQQPGTSSPQRHQAELNRAPVSNYLEASQGWQVYLQEVLHPRQELENTARWACGRPTATELAGLDSDNDEYQAEMELEHMAGMQPVLYHRYHDEDDEDGDDEEGEDDDDLSKGVAGLNYAGTQAVTDGISNIDLNDPVQPWQEAHHMHGGLAGGGAFTLQDKEQQQQLTLQGMFSAASQPSAPDRTIGMEDDEVLLAGSDDEDATAQQGSPIATAAGTPPPGGPPMEQQQGEHGSSMQMAEPAPAEVSMLGPQEGLVGSFALPIVEDEVDEEEASGKPPNPAGAGTGSPQAQRAASPGAAEPSACVPAGMGMAWQPAAQQATTATGAADMQA